MFGAGDGLLVTTATPVAGSGDVVATAIMIPATSATMPAMTPAASNRMVQEEAGAVPDPSSVKGVPLCGWTAADGIPSRRPVLVAAASAARISGVPGKLTKQ